MELKEILFRSTRNAVDRYSATVTLLGEEDEKTKILLSVFKALYGVVKDAELEAEYAVWRETAGRTGGNDA